MALTRQRLHRAQNSTDLGWSDHHTKDVDVLTAMGITDARGELMALGSDLILLKMSTRSKSIFYIPGNDLYRATQQSAIDKIAKLAVNKGKNVRSGHYQTLAALALTEWLNELCGTCAGAGRMLNDGGMIVVAECNTCKGSGRRYYTKEDRIEAIGGSWEGEKNKLRTLYDEAFSDILHNMHLIIGRSVHVKEVAVRDLLEAW